MDGVAVDREIIERVVNKFSKLTIETTLPGGDVREFVICGKLIKITEGGDVLIQNDRDKLQAYPLIKVTGVEEL